MPRDTQCHLAPLLSLLLLLCLTHATAKRASQLQELPSLGLKRQEQEYQLPVTINHHSLRLAVHLRAGRSWIKQALCRVCELASEQCNASCLARDAPSISCDSSFCSSHGDYSDEQQGVEGEEADVFLKVGEDSQVLMSLLLANKLYQQHSEFGQFHLFDPDSSFHHAILTKTSSALELRNANKADAADLQELRQKQGSALNISMVGEDFDFGFLRVKRVTLHHVDQQEKYGDLAEEGEYEVEFSLSQLGVTVPVRVARRLEKHLNEVYLAGKKCRLLPRRLKCAGSVEMEELFRTLLHFQLNNQTLAVPLHLLVTGCSDTDCTTLLDFDQSAQNTVTLGSVLWELYSLEYSLEGRYAVFHRRTSQFDDLFLLDRISSRQANFLVRMLLIVYHTFRWLLVAVFWLAVLSLAVNLLLRWRLLLGWLRGILARRKQRRATALAQTDHEQLEQFEERPLRRINKLHDPFEDSETL